ncbi:hypothetical protein BKA70DRAFT_485377 [Coprinopsis sp. MPI-PUGE-AT-0042]|nr:hypothetical protein BKA70DRAFT_485377 [Coprinopsis sp. MPI-PUGE-AT-0042]
MQNQQLRTPQTQTQPLRMPQMQAQQQLQAVRQGRHAAREHAFFGPGGDAGTTASPATPAPTRSPDESDDATAVPADHATILSVLPGEQRAAAAAAASSGTGTGSRWSYSSAASTTDRCVDASTALSLCEERAGSGWDGDDGWEEQEGRWWVAWRLGVYRSRRTCLGFRLEDVVVVVVVVVMVRECRDRDRDRDRDSRTRRRCLPLRMRPR